MTYIYNIVLHTSIGEKKGTLVLQISDNKVDGVMNILGQAEPCHGTIKKHGKCKLSGRIITLMRRMNYVAYGTLSNEVITLTLHSGQETFQITGTACRQEVNH